MQKKDWELMCARVERQIRAVAEHDEEEAFMTCVAHAKLVCKLLVEQAPNEDALAELAGEYVMTILGEFRAMVQRRRKRT